jgi:hypothetical protein
VQRVVKRRGDQALQIAIASDRRRSSALNMGQRRSTDAARLSGLQKHRASQSRRGTHATTTIDNRRDERPQFARNADPRRAG